MQMSGWRRAVMSDNSELCLSWRGGSTMNSSYELWLCSFTDEANKGIKQSTSHTETHPYTESNVLAHYSESALRDTEADFLSTLSLSNLWENLHKWVNKHNQHNGIYTGHKDSQSTLGLEKAFVVQIAFGGSSHFLCVHCRKKELSAKEQPDGVYSNTYGFKCAWPEATSTTPIFLLKKCKS